MQNFQSYQKFIYPFAPRPTYLTQNNKQKKTHMTLRRVKMGKHFIFYDAVHGSRRRPAQWPGTNVSKSGSRREYSSASTRHRTAFRLSASPGRRCLGRRCRANGKVCALGLQASTTHDAHADLCPYTLVTLLSPSPAQEFSVTFM